LCRRYQASDEDTDGEEDGGDNKRAEQQHGGASLVAAEFLEGRMASAVFGAVWMIFSVC